MSGLAGGASPIAGEKMPDETRELCYQRIRDCVNARVVQYYHAHPERLDQRAQDAINEALEVMAEVFDILEEYELAPRRA